jgi:general secretion pathway protein H
MPTSTAATAEDRVTRNGFTLVEMMIVTSVMALLAGVAVLTFGPIGADPKDAATRFASRVAAARDQAILTGRPISAWVSPSGYGFDRFRDGRWEKLEQKPFEAADWGTGMQASLDGRTRVRFDGLGVADQPLRIRLSREGESAGVRIAASGEVTVE